MWTQRWLYALRGNADWPGTRTYIAPFLRVCQLSRCYYVAATIASPTLPKNLNSGRIIFGTARLPALLWGKIGKEVYRHSKCLGGSLCSRQIHFKQPGCSRVAFLLFYIHFLLKNSYIYDILYTHKRGIKNETCK